MSLERSIRFLPCDTIIVLENFNQIFGMASTSFSRIFDNSKNELISA
jgi:hypothetical protein